MKGFHECEMKFHMDNDEVIGSFIEILHNQGYKEQHDRFETDFIFDTYSETLKKEKVLLRVRSLVIMNVEDIFFTVKTKGGSSSFQDSMEFETNSSNFNAEMAQTITDIIYDKIGISLPKSIFEMNSINDIVHTFKSVGLTPANVVQKKRKEYTGINAKVLIDSFPKIQGFFVEIESDSEKKLFESIKELDLDMSLSDKRNYGQIIAEMTNNEKILMFDD